MTYLQQFFLAILSACTILLLGGFLFDPSPTQVKPDSGSSNGDILEGAWELMRIRGQETEDVQIRMVKIISGGHFSFAFFNDKTQQFFSAGGGKYSYADGKYTEHIEFHTIDPALAGTSVTFNAEVKGNRWVHTGIVGGDSLREVYQRIDKGKGKEHIGAWEIFRMSNDAGKMVPQDRNLRTIKLLSGKRFQWATWETKKGSFVGTGGGTYEIKKGYYTENIEFFSRDSIRVGQSITFGCEIQGDTWHHEEYAGSRGLQINEIWTRME